jgi:hypothetical protein
MEKAIMLATIENGELPRYVEADPKPRAVLFEKKYRVSMPELE